MNEKIYKMAIKNALYSSRYLLFINRKEHAMTSANERKPREGFIVLESWADDMSEWDGHATSYDPRGCSIHAEGAFKVREISDSDLTPDQVIERVCAFLTELNEGNDRAVWIQQIKANKDRILK